MKVKATFKSEKPIDLPTDERGVSFLEKDKVKFVGRPGHRSIVATFAIPFKSDLLVFDYESTVTLQFNAGTRQYIFVTCDYADLHQVYEYLASTFRMQFILEKFHLTSDLLEFWTRWRWNIDYLSFQFRLDLERTVAFVLKHLPELITVMSLRKIPREFNEPFKFIELEPVPCQLDW